MVQDPQVTEGINELIKLQDSKGWNILVAQFRKDVHAALMEIEAVDPADANKIRDIQMRIKCYRALIDRPRELIQSGVSEEELAEDTPDEFRLEEETDYEPDS